MRLIALLILATLVAACADSADDADPPARADGTATPDASGDDARTTRGGDRGEGGTGVRTSVVTLTDMSRSTPATAGAPVRAGRELPTFIYEPEGEGPHPLILFAHGLNGHPEKFTQLHTAWAEAGYVIVAPTFPVSNERAPGGGDFIDLNQQPADLGFVLDQLLGPDPPLVSTVDPNRVGVGGLSLGGATVYGFAYDDCCRDDRAQAALVLDGNELSFTPDLTTGPPLLLIHADPDPSLPYENAVAHFAEATVPAAFLTLHETAHAEPYEDVDDPADDVVEQVTTAWWDRWLGDGSTSADALERIDAAVTHASDLTSWQARL